MAEYTIAVQADVAPLQRALDELVALARASDRSQRVATDLLESGVQLVQLRSVQAEPAAALARDLVLLQAQPSEELLRCLAALRAGDVDAG